MQERPARSYEITPEPSEPEHTAIVEALERMAQEAEAPLPWAALARREAVDDGLA